MKFSNWFLTEVASSELFVSAFSGNPEAIRHYFATTFAQDPSLKKGFQEFAKKNFYDNVASQLQNLNYKILVNDTKNGVFDPSNAHLDLSKVDTEYVSGMKTRDNLPELIRNGIGNCFFILKKSVGGNLVGMTVSGNSFYKLDFLTPEKFQHFISSRPGKTIREYDPVGGLIGAKKTSPSEVLLGLEQTLAVYKLATLLKVSI